MTSKTYDELLLYNSFKERYEYLKLDSAVGIETFGWDRYLNQTLYHSEEWRKFRREIIIRDNGCDLGVQDRPILGNRIIIHHINPLTKRQVLNRDQSIFDPQNVICCCHDTHMAIHYGTIRSLNDGLIERKRNDTCPWKH